mgnify:CR=1 FL=1
MRRSGAWHDRNLHLHRFHRYRCSLVLCREALSHPSPRLKVAARSDRSRNRYASFAVVAYVHETAISDWATAFVNVALVLLHLLAACIMSLLLWTVDRTIWVQLSIRDEPEEQQP